MFSTVQQLLLLLVNVKYVLSYETTLFQPENKAPFYRYFSDPVSDPDLDPDLDPDSNPDQKRLFRFRIRPKVSDPSGSGSGSRSARLVETVVKIVD
jgi:hypothetical protein